jgi:hypothetical protein
MEGQSAAGTSADRMALLFGDMFDGAADFLVVPCNTKRGMSAQIWSHLEVLPRMDASACSPRRQVALMPYQE